MKFSLLLVAVVLLLSGRQSVQGPPLFTRVLLLTDQGVLTPVKRARVILTDTAGNRLAQYTLADGTLPVQRTERTASVEVAKPGLVTESVPSCESKSVTCNLVMVKGASIEGTVVDQAGNGIAGLSVSAISAQDAVSSTAQTNDVGQFRVASLRAATYRLEVRSSVGRPSTAKTMATYPREGALILERGQEAGGIVIVTPEGTPTLPAVRTTQTSAPPQVGSATIAGTVIDSVSQKRVPTATVNLKGLKVPNGVLEKASGSGDFLFPQLVEGSYRVTATAPGFAEASFGQNYPTDLGRPLDLSQNERVEGVVLRILPKRTISGTVLDEDGNPVAGVLVQAGQTDFIGGYARLLPAADQVTAVTDDLGRFRIAGVPAGEYYLTAISGPFSGADYSPSFAPTYYPSTSQPSEATLVSNRNADVAGLVIRLSPSPTAAITVRIVDESGGPAKGVRTILVRTSGGEVRTQILARALTEADGTATYRDVPAGSYVVQAYHGQTFGSAAISLGARSETVDVRMGPGATCRGQYRFEDPSLKEPRPEAGGLHLIPYVTDFTTSPFIGQGPPTQQNLPDGSFEARGFFGTGFLTVWPAGNWRLKSVLLKTGSDVSDEPVLFETACRDELTIILTTVTARLGGSAVGDGRPVLDYMVLVIPANAKVLTSPFRGVVVARPNQRGEFRFDGMLPGDYLAVALPPRNYNDWQDPGFLGRARPYATEVHLSPQANKQMVLPVQNVR